MKSNFLLLSFLLTLCTISVNGQKVINLVGQKAPDFVLTKLNNNEQVKLSEIDNSKIIVIEFFATWCGPCVKAIPHMNALAETFSTEPVLFMYVTYEENGEKLNKFIDRFSLKPPVYIDKGFEMFKAYESWAIPQSLIINKDRVVVANIHPTKLTEEILRDAIQGKEIHIEDNGERTYFEPKGAENFFKEQSKSESGN